MDGGVDQALVAGEGWGGAFQRRGRVGACKSMPKRVGLAVGGSKGFGSGGGRW